MLLILGPPLFATPRYRIILRQHEYIQRFGFGGGDGRIEILPRFALSPTEALVYALRPKAAVSGCDTGTGSTRCPVPVRGVR